jgi:hypothetical protein
MSVGEIPCIRLLDAHASFHLHSAPSPHFRSQLLSLFYTTLGSQITYSNIWLVHRTTSSI